MHNECNTPRTHDSTHLHTSTSSRSHITEQRSVSQSNNKTRQGPQHPTSDFRPTANNTRTPIPIPPCRQSANGLTVPLTHRHRAARAGTVAPRRHLLPARLTRNGSRGPYQTKRVEHAMFQQSKAANGYILYRTPRIYETLGCLTSAQACQSKNRGYWGQPLGRISWGAYAVWRFLCCI